MEEACHAILLRHDLYELRHWGASDLSFHVSLKGLDQKFLRTRRHFRATGNKRRKSGAKRTRRGVPTIAPGCTPPIRGSSPSDVVAEFLGA